jgi:hypothetical protein
MQCALLEPKASTKGAWDVDETEVKRPTRRRRPAPKAVPATVPPAPALSPTQRRAQTELIQTMLAHLRAGGDARLRKVRRLRAAIKVGAYENNLKLQIALDRMIRDHGW